MVAVDTNMAATLEKLVDNQLWPIFGRERERLDRVDRWARWEHDRNQRPAHATREYAELDVQAQTPWLDLVVSSLVQTLYVEGYRRPKDPDDAKPWSYWQANCMDARQIAIHRAAVTYGLAYVTVVNGEDDQGERIPVIRGASPRRMVALYEDPCDDDWPIYALRADPTVMGGNSMWRLRLYDDMFVHNLVCGSRGGESEYLNSEKHGASVCPVTRFANRLDLEGRSHGEVEPFIQTAARIDQTIFDREVVQRFGAWIVKYVTGLERPPAVPEGDTPTPEQWQAMKLRLSVDSFLVAPDPDTKFGSLPATPLDGYIAAHESDVHDLAAVSQTPPHYLLGQMINVSAEALAAAEATATRKRTERQHGFGESWEKCFRLAASIMGDTAGAKDVEAQVIWRDVESRSLAQAADALGKLATMLGVPVEMLWEKVPGWTQQDVERAKALAAEQGGIELLTKQLINDATGQQGIPGPGLSTKGQPAQLAVSPSGGPPGTGTNPAAPLRQ